MDNKDPSSIKVISKAEQTAIMGDTPYWKTWYDGNNPLWQKFNQRAMAAIQARKEPDDILATIAGTASLQVAAQHPELTFLEYSIGYRGVCAPYRIYQSQAWRHVSHGYLGLEYGRITDDVIYHWFHEDEFPTRQPDDYVLYVGRLTAVKGLTTVCRAAEAAKVKLYVIGEGDVSLITYGEYIGHMPPEERNRWMAGARALIAPTEYLEPSACVVTEAQLCGTPVIGPNWGGFPEYVEHGKTGILCKSFEEYVSAISTISSLDRGYVRDRARALYGWHAGLTAYQQYFDRIDQNRSSRVSAAQAAVS